MSSPELIPELLEKYSNEKFGYGNPGDKNNPTIWFVGPEEGGNYGIEKEARIQAWFSISKGKNFVDIFEFHQKLDSLLTGYTLSQHFIGKKLINPTWGGIVQIIAGCEGGECLNREEKREFQANKLGRIDSGNCVLELSPFSSKALKDKSWPDKNITLENMLPKRILALSDLIVTHRPKVIFMHTKAYWTYYQEVINLVDNNSGHLHFSSIDSFPGFKYYQGEFTLFVLIHAPFRLKGVDEKKNELGKEVMKIARRARIN
jgi:hypothetical protein